MEMKNKTIKSVTETLFLSDFHIPFLKDERKY